MTAALLLLACVALLAPGLLVARRLVPGASWPTGLVVSWMLVLHVVLVLDAVGAPVRASFALLLLALVAAAAWAAPAVAPVDAPARPTSWSERASWGVVAALLALFALRMFMQPITGLDTPFRWEYLSRVLLAREALDFYPPLEAADFEVYFYPDGIPPLVSCVYWLLYAALGEPAPRATAIVVAAQWAGVVVLVARLAGRLGGTPRAGYTAALLAATCPFIAQAVGCGQEAGVIALALLAALVLVVEAEPPRADRALVLAGVCVATCGLSREFGLAFVPVVAFFAFRRGFGARGALVTVAAAIVACAPWYVRTLVLTGNALWGSPGSSSTPVLAAFLRAANDVHGWSNHTSEKLGQLVTVLLLGATLPLIVGGVALVADRRARALWPPVVVASALFVTTAAYSLGGVAYTTRLLLPAAAVAAAAGGLLLDAVAARGPRLRALVIAVLATSGAWGALCMLAFPASRPQVGGHGLLAHALRATPVLVRGYGLAALPHLPPSGAVLTTNAYLAVDLRAAGRRSVMMWSPEVAFLFDPAVGWDDARARLRGAGVVAWADLRDPVLDRFLATPFFVEARRRIPVAAPGLLEIRVLPAE